MICPDCNGEKEVKIFPKLVNGKVICSLPCSRCNQTGIVPDIQAEWILRGKGRREERRSRKVTLRDEALRLNVSALDLSNAERGMVDPDAVGGIKYTV